MSLAIKNIETLKLTEIIWQIKKNVISLHQLTNKTLDIMKKVELKDYCKAKTLEDIVQLWNDWEEDRASDGEYTYNLDKSSDAAKWIELYGVEIYNKCRKQGQYWFGGYLFSCKGANTDAFCEAWCITEDSLPIVLDIIEGVWKSYLFLNPFGSLSNQIKEMTKMYHDLIDFKGYAIALGFFGDVDETIPTDNNNKSLYEVTLTYSKHIEVYADSKEDAIKKAKELSIENDYTEVEHTPAVKCLDYLIFP